MEGSNCFVVLGIRSDKSTYLPWINGAEPIAFQVAGRILGMLQYHRCPRWQKVSSLPYNQTFAVLFFSFAVYITRQLLLPHTDGGVVRLLAKVGHRLHVHRAHRSRDRLHLPHRVYRRMVKKSRRKYDFFGLLKVISCNWHMTTYPLQTMKSEKQKIVYSELRKTQVSSSSLHAWCSKISRTKYDFNAPSSHCWKMQEKLEWKEIALQMEWKRKDRLLSVEDLFNVTFQRSGEPAPPSGVVFSLMCRWSWRQMASASPRSASLTPSASLNSGRFLSNFNSNSGLDAPVGAPAPPVAVGRPPVTAKRMSSSQGWG